MTPSISFKVHRIVEYLKSTGFDLETDEVREMELADILEGYDIFVSLPPEEQQLLRDELLMLAEKNEIREGLQKTRETMGVDWELMHTTPGRASFYGCKRSPQKEAFRGL